MQKLLYKKIFLAICCFCLFFTAMLHASVDTHIASFTEEQQETYRSHILNNINLVIDKINYFRDKYATNPESLSKIVNLFVEIKAKEQNFPEYYQVVTAQDAQFFAYQVIAKELYRRIHHEERDDYEFLRYPGSFLISSLEALWQRYPHLLDKGESSTADSLPGDISPPVSRHLLSVSLSLEQATAADSTFSAFLFGKGFSEWSICKEEEAYRAKFVQHVIEIFDSAGIEGRIYQPYLERLLEDIPKTEEGIINQIFLPKSTIEKYIYVSLPLGFVDTSAMSNIKGFFDDFLLHAQQGDFDGQINIQARVLAAALFDPEVRIFRYTLIPEVEQESYRHKVKDILDELFEELNQIETM